MRSFFYERVSNPSAAIRAAESAKDDKIHAQYLAGGTTLVDLMKLNVMQPDAIIDINALDGFGRIDSDGHSLRLGAAVRMAEAAEHPEVKSRYPVIAQTLQLAASQQLRNMASLAGNVLQRTRCSYFRDTSYGACNKRLLGSGCAALEGVNRAHAVLGTSEHCIATYPGDFAQALMALDACVEIMGASGRRMIPFGDLHRKPGDTPDRETNLRDGDLILSFVIPAVPWARRSIYVKVRDRESYEFALASAAVALELEDGVARNVRIALGGVATIPWRATEAEALLRGKQVNDQNTRAAADAAFAAARGYGRNDFKIELGKRTLRRALMQAAALEV